MVGMVRIENRVIIAATVERIWNAVEPLSNLKNLMPGIVDTHVSGRPKGVGMKLLLTTTDNSHYEAKVVEFNPRRDLTIREPDGRQSKWHFEQTPRGVLAINIITGDIPADRVVQLKKDALEKMIRLKERVE